MKIVNYVLVASTGDDVDTAVENFIVVYAPEPVTPSQAQTMKRYSFNTASDVHIGDRIQTSLYETPMQVVEILPQSFRYIDTASGELSNEKKMSTKQFEIRELSLPPCSPAEPTFQPTQTPQPMTIIQQIKEELITPLCASLDRIATAISASSGGTVPLSPPNSAARRGRPPKGEVAPPDEPTAPAEPEAPPPDYDAIMTESLKIASGLLQIDQQQKTSANKDKLVSLWKELHPTGNGKLSGLPKEKLPEALERLKQLAA